jgi:preprotein translocase subunit SecA
LRKNTAEEDEDPNGHYDIDEKSRSISLTDIGIVEVERRIEEIDPMPVTACMIPAFST